MKYFFRKGLFGNGHKNELVFIANELADINLNIKKLIWVIQDPKHENKFTRDNLFNHI